MRAYTPAALSAFAHRATMTTVSGIRLPLVATVLGLALVVVLASGSGCAGDQGAARVTAGQATATTTPPRTDDRRHAPPALPLAGRIVLIDPGHNGGNAAASSEINTLVPAGRGRTKACDTTGTATNDGRLTEALFNWLIASAVATSLERAGARVVLTRSQNTGVGPCIDRRAQIGNQAHADIALSIHADGGPPSGSGFHVIYPASSQALVRPAIVGPSYRAARHVRAALREAGRVPADYAGTGGLSERDDLGGLNLSTVPKAFVELGNMRNAADAAALEDAKWRRATAAALTSGIQRFLGTGPG